MILDPGLEGVRVGHWTDRRARTGCTVVLFPDTTVASGEVRGGAPATREFDLLRPDAMVGRLDACVLTGGSAFGLAAADGVMSYCEPRGRGFRAGAHVVPIVVAMALFDLAEGDGSVRPGPEEGLRACLNAEGDDAIVEVGAVGAGTGATVDKWRGRQLARPGGLGLDVQRDGELVVAALAAVNAFGMIDDGAAPPFPPPVGPDGTDAWENAPTDTTLALVVTNADIDKAGCFLVAQGGHDGMARALRPAHTRADGDAVVAAATRRGAPHTTGHTSEHVRYLATIAVERAIRSVSR